MHWALNTSPSAQPHKADLIKEETEPHRGCVTYSTSQAENVLGPGFKMGLSGTKSPTSTPPPQQSGRRGKGTWDREDRKVPGRSHGGDRMGSEPKQRCGSLRDRPVGQVGR